MKTLRVEKLPAEDVARFPTLTQKEIQLFPTATHHDCMSILFENATTSAAIAPSFQRLKESLRCRKFNPSRTPACCGTDVLLLKKALSKCGKGRATIALSLWWFGCFVVFKWHNLFSGLDEQQCGATNTTITQLYVFFTSVVLVGGQGKKFY